MLNHFISFLQHWAVMALAIALTGALFRGVSVTGWRALALSALLLGIANAVIRPVLIMLTLPLTFLTFGFFLLVINALMLLLVASVVDGFKVSGFWTALWASVSISVMSYLLEMLIPGGGMVYVPIKSTGGVMV